MDSLIAFDESNWSFLKSNGTGVLRDGRGHITVIASLRIFSAPKVLVSSFFFILVVADSRVSIMMQRRAEGINL